MKKTPNLVFESYDLSSEFFTTEGDTPFAIKNSEILALDMKRPLGLSGHLRAKNEAFTIKDAIDSSIPALDELIITIQPYINESGIDETYKIAKEAKEKYGDKIKLFYYTPECASWGALSHIKSEIECDDNRSIHSFAHYYNFGLKEISYKYYIKIDADQIYFTQKLRELREAIISSDRWTKNKRSFFDKVIGRLCNPLYNTLVRILPLKSYIKFVTFINKKYALDLVESSSHSHHLHYYQIHQIGGGQIEFLESSKAEYNKNLKSNQNAKSAPNPESKQNLQSSIDKLLSKPLSKELLCKMNIPLKIHHNRFYCLNGGMDHYIFAPDSTNLYYYFKEHGVETQNLNGNKGVRNLGCFWVHLGMIKRYFLAEGQEGKDYIHIENFLNTKIKNLKDRIEIRAHYTPDYQGSLDNINIHLENDKKYLRELLKDEVKISQTDDNPINTK